MMKKLFFYGLTFLLVAVSHAAIQSKPVNYKDGDTNLHGVFYYDDAWKTKHPGVLVAHEWMGINDYSKKRAQQLAQEGYAALALDVYGKDRLAADFKEAAEWSTAYKSNRPLLRSRMIAALKTLREQPHVNSQSIAAIGYCFGGTAVLELARSGADIKGIASFHGGLNTPTPQDAKQIKSKVLVLHGANDPYVSATEVTDFQKEMRDAGTDWQMNIYSNAVHGFTNPSNGNDPSKGMAYNKEADLRSWQGMKIFFKEIFGE